MLGQFPGHLGHEDLGNDSGRIDVHTTHCYKYGSLRRVYRRARKTATLSLSPPLISPITFHFNSGLFGVTSDTGHHLVGALSNAGTQSCRSPISLHTRGSYESVERSTFYPEQHNIVVLMRQPASRSQKGPLLQKGGGLQTPGFCMNYVPVTSSRILCSPLPLSTRTAPTTLPSNPKVTNTRDS